MDSVNTFCLCAQTESRELLSLLSEEPACSSCQMDQVTIRLEDLKKDSAASPVFSGKSKVRKMM